MIAAALIAVAAAAGPVHLRGEPAPDPRPVESVSIEGVRVGGDAPETIGWERVRALTGDDAAAARDHEWLMENAWRMLARIRRGDLPLAGPDLERMDEVLHGVRSTTSLLAAAGLASLRTSEGRAVDAVEPALRARTLQRFGARLEDGLLAGLGYDDATGLWPLLPPLPTGDGKITAWTGLPARLAPLDPDESSQGLAVWYEYAAALATGAPAEAPAAAEGEPLSMVAAMVRAALHPDASQRAVARETLQSMAAEAGGGWREVWMRMALGRSLAREADEESRRRGLVESLTAAALATPSHRQLAAAALADAARAAEALNMRAEAGALWSRAREMSPSGAAAADERENQ